MIRSLLNRRKLLAADDEYVTHDDPPPPEHDVATEELETAHADEPPNPSTTTDDVVITGTGFKAPSQPSVLAKHTSQGEAPAFENSKLKVNLESYTNLGPQELHSGYLNRLYTSHDYEAGLVNMMKDRYEVTPANRVFPYSS